MNLALVNEQHRLYEYIITDSTKVIAEELQPPGFETMEYHSKIKAKSVNEIKSKLAYLKKCDLVLQERILKESDDYHVVDEDYIEMVRMFLLQTDLLEMLQVAYPNALKAYNEER